MQISHSTAGVPGGVQPAASGGRAPRVESNPPAQAAGPAEPTDPPQTTLVERMAGDVRRARRRIDAVVDDGSLSKRQAMALDKVERRFERMSKRLAGAVEDGGVARDGIHRGLDIVYGKLRGALTDILANGRGDPGATHGAELTGLVVDEQA
jgi:hypothetical protein